MDKKQENKNVKIFIKKMGFGPSFLCYGTIYIK